MDFLRLEVIKCVKYPPELITISISSKVQYDISQRFIKHKYKILSWVYLH
jgi:hypothetical protein